MEFYTKENNIKESTPNGNIFEPIYQEALDKKGHLYLKEVGKTNVYENIQASKDNAILEIMLEKYQKTGDASIFETRQTFYDDFTNLPSSPIDLQNRIMQAERAFYTLDKEVRDEFHNDVGEFKASIYTGEIDSRMSKFLKKDEPASEQPAQPTNTEGGVQL